MSRIAARQIEGEATYSGNVDFIKVKNLQDRTPYDERIYGAALH